MRPFNARIAAALAVSALGGVSIAAAAPVRPGDSRAAAEALTGAPATETGGATYRAAAARGVAGRRAAAVPLPAGGTFAGIQWERGGDAIRPSDIEGVLEYNAACQWLRAWRDGRDGALALRVLQAIPSWPFLRGTESGEVLAKVAAEAAAGGGELATAVLADCDASHAREVAYATQMGLTSSR